MQVAIEECTRRRGHPVLTIRIAYEGVALFDRLGRRARVHHLRAFDERRQQAHAMRPRDDARANCEVLHEAVAERPLAGKVDAANDGGSPSNRYIGLPNESS